MKHFPFAFLLIFLHFSSLSAQDCQKSRYKNRVFDEIKITTDLVYGQVDPYEVVEVNNLVDISLDFYEPVGDNLEKRPLVVSIYGGAFLFGTKEDSDVQAWCDSLTRRGYACAAINYRLGLNLTSPRSAYRAVYRAVQDLRAAIRYLEEDPDNLGFRVDPDNIFAEGQSAGAITAIHTAFLSEDERPTATFADNLSIDEGSDLGCLDCSGNNFIQPVKIKAILSMWGAVENLLFIDEDEVTPMLMVHGDGDPVVPYGTGRPFSSPFFPTVHGSSIMQPRLDEVGFYNEFYPYIGNMQHTVYGEPIAGTFPTENWLPIFENSQKFLYTVLKYDSPTPTGETNVIAGENYTYSVSIPDNSSACWTVTGGTIMQDNGDNIVVNWDNDLEDGTVSVRENNYFDLKGEPTTLNISRSSNDALPLSWMHFSGKVQEEQIVLKWSISAATHLDYFVIEKSNDGQNFIDIAQKSSIDKAFNNYQYNDLKPETGGNYYRLRAVDTDGHYMKSEIISINFEPNSLNIIPLGRNQIKIDFQQIPKETFSIEVFDLNGRMILHQKQRKLTTSSYSLDLSNISNGTYILQVKSLTKVEAKKIIIH